MLKKLSAVFLILLLLGGCQTAPAGEGKTPPDRGGMEGDAMAEYRKITAEEAKEMMAAPEVVIVDVRTGEEYAGGHIENAILIPNESIMDEPPEQLPDKDAVILLYCRSGRRSQEAADKLLSLGYQNVYDFGGIIDWPYDIVKD